MHWTCTRSIISRCAQLHVKTSAPRRWKSYLHPCMAVIRVVLCSFSVRHFNRKWSSSPVSDWHSWHILSDAGGFGDLYLPDNCIQSTCLISYSTTVCAYEDCKDSICQFIPCALCKNVSEATSVVHFLWFQQSCKLLACFACLLPSTFVKSSRPWSRQAGQQYGRCLARPRANLSYAIAKVRLYPL